MRPALALVPFLWIGASAQVQIQPPDRSSPLPPAQTGKASIEGSVLDAVTREPVKKASVMLNGPVSLNAVTDSSGHFAFRQLLAGQYFIHAQSEKYPQGQNPLDALQPVTVSLAAEEQKKDIRLALTPGASVRGRIVDEDRNPMQHCNVTAMRFRDMGAGRTLQQFGFAQSDDKGQYRVANLPRGRYYMQARCNQTWPLPHAFLRRSAAMDAPVLTYAPQFYGGAADPAGAAKVEVQPGADISGIDFQMTPARGVTLRGRVGSVPDRGVRVTLAPQDPVGREWRSQGGGVNPSTGEFRIPNVLPGSYELVAVAWSEGSSYIGKVPVEIGDAPLEPIVLALAPAPAISGTISVEGDTADPPANLPANLPANKPIVMMNPTDGQPMMGPPPRAEVQSDGTFNFSSVLPGRWHLILNGAGYIKSVKLGEREVPPWDIEIGSSAAQLKVVITTRYTRLDVLSAVAAESEPVSAVIWPVSGDPGFQQNITLNSQGPSMVNVPPGRYYACALAVAQPWMLMQNIALRKSLESRCETVEAPEGGTARVQVTPIPASDLKELLEKVEQ